MPDAVSYPFNFAQPRLAVGALGVEPGMVVADFGAGSGAHVPHLAEAVGSGGRVYAVDVQRELLSRIKREAARRAHHHVDVLWGDIEEMQGSKLPDDHADLVLMSNILFQLADKRAALAEARRVLKREGRLAVVDWQDRPYAIEGGIRVGPERERLVSQDEALQYALRTGFEPIDTFDAGAHHYGIIFRRVRDSL